MKNIGIVDIGSNTVRLVIYTLHEQTFSKTFDYKKMLQLLNFVDHQQLSTSGLRSLIDTLDEYQQIAQYFSVDKLVCFGTASLRYLENKQEVVRKIFDYTGLSLILLTGEEEALYGFEALQHTNQLKEEGISVDVGGGSTEIVHYKDNKIIHSISLPFGCLSLQIKHMNQLFPSTYELQQITHDINTLLDQIHWLNHVHCDSMIGIGGSARAIVKTIRYLHPSSSFEPKENIDFNFVTALSQIDMTQQPEIAQIILKAIVERSSTLQTGALIFSEIAKRTHAQSFSLSREGLREGYIYHLIKANQTTNSDI